MKSNNILALSLFLAFAATLEAQTYLGVKIGYTNAWESYGITQVPDNAEIDIDSKNASIFWYKPFSAKYELGIEPGFVQRGANCIPGFIGPWIGDTRIKISYLNLPLNCKRNFKIGERFILYAKAGPELAAAISAVEELVDMETNEVIDSRKMSIGQFEEVNDFNFGLNAGGGLEFPLGPGHFVLEGVYYHSVSHAVRSTFSLNRNMNASLGYGMRF